MIKHAAANLYECSICKVIAYQRQDNLRRHMKDKHGHLGLDTTKRQNRLFCPFKCDEGPFRLASDLIEHCDHEHSSNIGPAVL